MGILKRALCGVVIFAMASCQAFAQQSGGLKLRVYKPRYRSAQSYANVLENAKSVQGRVSIDSKTNSIIILDTPEDIARIESLLYSLDMPQKQVEMKVLITEVSEEYLQETGISSAQTVLSPASFSMALKLLQAHKESVVRSEMTLRTLDNEPAQLQVARDELYGRVVGRSADGSPVAAARAARSGEFLSVIPQVLDDSLIYVTVLPSRSSVSAEGVQSSSVLTQVTVKPGETVAICGVDTIADPLNEEAKALGIPVYRQKAFSKKKVLMFLTVWIEGA